MPKARIFWPIFIGWLVLDLITKRWALATLMPGVPNEVVGEYLRWTLTFNRGAAMGMNIGEWSRVVFTVIGVGMLGVLGWLYRRARPDDRLRTAILAFIMAGALGNLIDRVRSARGVTDFIDVGVGTVRFWTFNVADMGITCGAIALAIILELDARKEKAAAAPS
jgi:signal peptidase II